MKKFLYSLLVGSVLLAPVAAYAVPEPTFETWSTKSSQVGKQGNPVRVLKLIRMASRDANTVSAASGDVVVYDKTSDDGVTVAHTTTSADGAIAGILATSVATADGASTKAQDDAGHRNWGWMVVHGPMTANVIAGGTNGNSAGHRFITSRDTAAVSTFEDLGTFTVDAAAVEQATRTAGSTGGFFYDAADTTSTTVDVFVELE